MNEFVREIRNTLIDDKIRYTVGIQNKENEIPYKYEVREENNDTLIGEIDFTKVREDEFIAAIIDKVRLQQGEKFSINRALALDSLDKALGCLSLEYLKNK